jgi:hypothetical protein
LLSLNATDNLKILLSASFYHDSYAVLVILHNLLCTTYSFQISSLRRGWPDDFFIDSIGKRGFLGENGNTALTNVFNRILEKTDRMKSGVTLNHWKVYLFQCNGEFSLFLIYAFRVHYIQFLCYATTIDESLINKIEIACEI